MTIITWARGGKIKGCLIACFSSLRFKVEYLGAVLFWCDTFLFSFLQTQKINVYTLKINLEINFSTTITLATLLHFIFESA